jgi:hypothetical protein
LNFEICEVIKQRSLEQRFLGESETHQPAVGRRGLLLVGWVVWSALAARNWRKV